MANVFITGVSGYIGMKLAAHFAGCSDVGRIVGIDLRPPAVRIPRLEFIAHDVRRDMRGLMTGGGFDWAIHAAFCLAPQHDERGAEAVNLGGTRNFLAACAAAAVPQVIQISSATAYGCHPDNPPLLTEASPLRGNRDFVYARNKRELERVCAEFADRHPGQRLCVLRPCFVVGPGFDNALARHLRKRLVLLPTSTAGMQFVHEDDLACIIHRLCQERLAGVFNVAADGVLSVEEMVGMLGGRPIRLPMGLLGPLNSLAWRLRLKRLSEFPTPALALVRFPWRVDNAKLKRVLGYRFRYDSREAFADFAQCVTGGNRGYAP